MARPFAFHEDLTRAETVDGGSDRGFGFVFAGVAVVVGASELWHGASAWPWWLSGAALILAVALLRPRLLAPFNRLWTKLGVCLVNVVSPLVLGVLFLTTIAPIGLMLRAARRDPLRRKRDPQATSYWIAREPPGPAPETMKNQF